MARDAIAADASRADARWSGSGEADLALRGAWTVVGLARLPPLRAPAGCRSLRVRADSRWALDSAGACVLDAALRDWQAQGIVLELDLPERATRLLALVRARARTPPPRAVGRHAGVLGDIGRGACAVLQAAGAFSAMLGELVWRGTPQLARWWRIRWREVVAEVEAAGVRAIGIVALLSFLIGMVMAYQGGATLATYGANILIVNLVAIITLREMGPLLCAILVAGRTGSSYAAQLGTMRITEEIDALRVLALEPFDILVLPKVLALVVAMPLLSLLADAMGLFGGGVVAAVGFGVPWRVYVERIPQVVNVTTLLLGLVKAPVFAVVIALVGCMQGLRVRGGTAEVGRATTSSVVQAIFLVIVLDAGFSVLYNMLGL